MAVPYINIKFPFTTTQNQYFFDSDTNSYDLIKSNLLHLLITKKGERIYRPDFGTSLMDFIFEPLDAVTKDKIEKEFKDSIAKYLPQVTITSISFEAVNQQVERQMKINVQFTINDGALSVKDEFGLLITR